MSPSTKTLQDPQTTQALRLTIGGTKKTFPSATFSDKHEMDKLKDEILKSSTQVKVFLRTVRNWPPRERLRVLSFLASLKGNIRFFVGDQQSSHDNLFTAVLALLRDTSDVSQIEQMKRMAIDAAVSCRPDVLESAVDQILARLKEIGILTRLKEIGVKGFTRAKLLSDAKALREWFDLERQIAKSAGTMIREVLPNAPVNDKAMIPRGWKLTAEGIEQIDGRMPIVSAPVLVVGRQIDIESKAVSLEVAWMRGGKWDYRILARKDAANTRTISDELSQYGVPVTSNNARTLVQFLSDYETTNLAHIPFKSVSHQLGWQGEDGLSGFLLGKKFFCAPGQTSEVVFQGRDEGDDQFARGFRVKGDLVTWLKAIKRLRSHFTARLVLYAGFAAPLLQIVNAPGFCLDIAGQTTTGKSTMLRADASIWGDPDDSNPDSTMKTWDSTAVFRERAPAVLNSLPLILDDTKLASKKPGVVATTIFSIAGGAGRGRGSVKGLALSQTFNTLLITSGEQPLTSFSGDGGTRTRVLSLWGLLFGARDSATGKRVSRLNNCIKKNYGHAGVAFVTYLVNNQNLWDGWRKQYQGHTQEYETLAGDDSFAARMAPMMAVICLAAELAHESLEMPWKYTDPIVPVWAELTRNTQDANRPLAALRYVKDWGNAHPDEFFSIGRESTSSQPSDGWAGRWDLASDIPEGTRRPQTWIGFFPSRLVQLLREGGFEAQATLRTWDDNGWLEKTSDSGGARHTMRSRMGKEKIVRLTAITRLAWDQADQA